MPPNQVFTTILPRKIPPRTVPPSIEKIILEVIFAEAARSYRF
jgi:hypothetical protein